MLLLIRGARKVDESIDVVTDLFWKLSNFALLLAHMFLSARECQHYRQSLGQFHRVCPASQTCSPRIRDVVAASLILDMVLLITTTTYRLG
ncbi:hypothetical protein BDW71DRAFT_173219 [Aspergillus fruticulosus]